MSRFLSKKYQTLRPYTPGEQPKDTQYIKLNTNESPFPPSPAVAEAVCAECGKLQLYSDPESYDLSLKLAECYGLEREQVIVTNGSDEALNFAFMAFADEERPLAFPDITYGFYPVFAQLNAIPYREIPLRADFSIAVQDYMGLNSTIVIANPNAPTGMCLSLEEIEQLLKSNPKGLVIIDEAYVDFGGQSAVGLIKDYDNLLVTGTFSKSRSMAGARIGYALGNRELIKDLNAIKYSTNPYNVNRMSSRAGCAALDENEYYMSNCRRIEENRDYSRSALEALGFEVLPSKANFVFARRDKLPGQELYRQLKAMGILVRHFDKARISDYVRITIGTREQMEKLIAAVEQILKERNI